MIPERQKPEFGVMAAEMTRLRVAGTGNGPVSIDCCEKNVATRIARSQGTIKEVFHWSWIAPPLFIARCFLFYLTRSLEGEEKSAGHPRQRELLDEERDSRKTEGRSVAGNTSTFTF